ncbi:MAG: hypothetical protein IT381_12415 [Deltaproteobacteria bacterium]|nr:hypothetical protein [Deltaproteobacteria bacterium]
MDLLRRLAWIASFAIALSSCRALTYPPPSRTKGIGADCVLDTECRRGMACVASLCASNASLAQDDKCDLTEGCQAGLYCSTEAQTCQPQGTHGLNESCTTSGDCLRGLYCGLSGLFHVCLPGGQRDIGAACTSAADCLAGLGCLGGQCAAGAPTAVIPDFGGVDCQTDSGAFRVYFQVPAAGQTNPDFFRLPFPNEARNRGTAGTDLAGFPRPANGTVGDMIARYVEAASLETGGGGANQAVTMRFSAPVQDTSLVYGITAPTTPTVYLFKVEPVDPAKIGALDQEFGCYTSDFDTGGTAQPLWKLTAVGGVVEWLVIPGRTPYLCANSFSFRPRSDNPLEPNTLYAVALSSEVRSDQNVALTRDADLDALLSSTAPATGDRLARPHSCYAPARAAFCSTANGNTGCTIPTGSGNNRVPLAALSLFRTQDTQAPVKAVLKTMASLPATATPQVTALVKCTPSAVSPCASATDPTRACPATDSPLYDEYHGKLRVPVLQAGTRPYLVDGGYIEYTDGSATRRRMAKTDDSAVVQGTEEVCFSLTVPEGPDFGDPNERAIAIYGHGTGGNFRTFTGEGQTDTQRRLIPGSDLASMLADGNGNPALAVLSFDQPLHGGRQPGVFPPDQLYFNVGNPRAMRDNGLQAVADYAQFVALAKAFAAGNVASAAGVDTALVTTLQSALAGSKRVFIGHSQGGTNGALYIAATPNTDVQAALFSGTGGGLTQSLLNKAQPIDFRTLINGALQDPQVNQYHPVLGLMQMVGERSDPINFGRSMIGIGTVKGLILPVPAGPSVSPNIKSLLHIIGFGDNYTPLRTASDLWRSFGTVPVLAANDAVEAGGQIGAFETDASARGPLKKLSAVADTGPPGGMLCNCTPLSISAGAVVTPGKCEATSTSDVAMQPTHMTAASIVYRPDRDYDGHFVMFEHPSARAQAKRFLQDSAASTGGFCTPGPVTIPQ